MPQIASRITRQTLEADVVVFTAKESVRISTVAFAVDDAYADSEGTVFLYTADESRIYFGITTETGSTTVIKVPWIADDGLKLVVGEGGNDSDLIVTLIHSALGA